MLQVAGIGNGLQAVHGTGCNFDGGAAESCVRQVRIVAGQSAAGAPTATIGRQYTFGGGSGVFYFWPGIAANTRNDIIVPFHHSSTGSYLSSYWTMKGISANRFNSPLTLSVSVRRLSEPNWDYIGAHLDPSDLLSFWVAGERATTIGDDCQWQTQVQKVVPGSIVPMPINPE
jgi:hypothetical protein